MTGFRDKFVFNTQQEGRVNTPDTEQFVFHAANLDNLGSYPSSSQRHPYSPITENSGYPREYGRQRGETHKNDPLPLPPGPEIYQNYPNSASSLEQHEMLDLPRNPFHDQIHTNTNEDVTNPFNDLLQADLMPETYDAYPENVVDDGPEVTQFEKDHRRLIRHQERNRRKLEARLPWYHYTQLPWFTILVTTIQVIVFIVELAKMTSLTGSAFQTKPYFNPMLGPSTYLLVSMGARYVPCMHRIDSITTDTLLQFPCPNSTSTDTDVCNLAQLCSLSGIPVVDNEYVPNQWYRVITPIFLHAGFLHILFNLLLQLTMGWSVEKAIGWIKFSVIYLASGVAGFLLGANFSPDGISSTGASGALFGIIATNFLLFIYCGRENTNIYKTKHYRLFILIMVVEVVVLFVLGLLPGLDNFSHIGGFCMGLLLAVTFLKDPSFVYNEGIYVYDPTASTMQLFAQNWNPMNNWEHKIRWKVFCWAALRVVCLVLAILFFALLFVNLYSKRMESDEEVCSWCKYLSCLPVNGWCEEGELTVSTVSSGSSASAAATSAAASATSSFPTSIDNPNEKRDLEFGAFSQSVPRTATFGEQLFDQSSAVFAFLGLMAMLSMSFICALRRREKITRT